MQEPLDTDVAIVGAGVVGCAIARELSQLRPARDAARGRARRRGRHEQGEHRAAPHGLRRQAGHARVKAGGARVRAAVRLRRQRVGIPVEHTGALLVAWNEEQRAEFPGIVERAHANGYREIAEVGGGRALPRASPTWDRAPTVRSRCRPRGSCARSPPRSPTRPRRCSPDATCAARPRSRRSARLDDGRLPAHHARRCRSRARYLVNAAGLHSDEIDRMLGHERFTVTPRRGELIVFDKLARPLVQHIVLAVPTKITKGVLIAPTVFGNVMLGPTAEDVQRKDDTESTPQGLAYLRAEGARIMPELLEHEVTAVYAGLRAATEHVDYQLSVHAPEGYACVGGIRSTGLTASMGIAEHVREQLGAAGLRLEPREEPPPEFTMPNIGERSERPYQRGELIEADRDYGRIVCFCERVTPRRDPRCAGRAGRGRGPRRASPPHARAHGPLPGLLLRRGDRRAARRAAGERPRGGDRRGAGRARSGGRAATARRGRGAGARARGGARRHPAPRAAPGLRPARPAPPAVRVHATRAATPSWPRGAGAELRTETMVTGWSPGRAARAHRPAGARDARARRGGARHRAAASARARRGSCPARVPRGCSPPARSSSSSTSRG